ncbi:MAG: DNA-binding protein WhiA [Eubacteriaceae bacterium]|nr:DNA-binding protein WhiA [Eubacteriaceae bacterium]
MSFSSKTKSDLCRMEHANKDMSRAELSGLIHMCGSISFEGRSRMSFQVKTENAAIARHVFKLVKSVYDVDVEVHTTKNKQFKNRNIYFVKASSPEDSMTILKDLEIINLEGGYINLNYHVPQRFSKQRELKKAYIRGAFLGGGSISDPEKAYHMEFTTSNELYAEELKNLINTFDLLVKVIIRKNSYILYLKESEQIVTLLSIIGAHSALLAIENIRIMKDMRNNVNRIVNCEMANLTKTVEAAYKHLESIEKIKNTVGLHRLSPGLREIAELRMNFQEASLKELGEMLNPPMGKSGVNHRLKKISEFAENL